jgi:hypothetical protein
MATFLKIVTLEIILRDSMGVILRVLLARERPDEF